MEGIDREDTLKLYDKILMGTRIAVNSLECIARKSASLQLSGEIRRTIGKYEEIDRKAARAILTLGGKPRRISKAMRLRDWWTVSVKAFGAHRAQRLRYGRRSAARVRKHISQCL